MGNQLTPSEYCREHGLDSLQEVIDKTGVSRQTLGNWFKNRSDLFRVLVLGVKCLEEEDATLRRTEAPAR